MRHLLSALAALCGLILIVRFFLRRLSRFDLVVALTGLAAALLTMFLECPVC